MGTVRAARHLTAPGPPLNPHAVLADMAASAPVEGFVVIDDYHVVSDSAMHDLLSLLIERKPANGDAGGAHAQRSSLPLAGGALAAGSDKSHGRE
jgi:hypothetical protein